MIQQKAFFPPHELVSGSPLSVELFVSFHVASRGILYTYRHAYPCPPFPTQGAHCTSPAVYVVSSWEPFTSVHRGPLDSFFLIWAHHHLPCPLWWTFLVVSRFCNHKEFFTRVRVLEFSRIGIAESKDGAFVILIEIATWLAMGVVPPAMFRSALWAIDFEVSGVGIWEFENRRI